MKPGIHLRLMGAMGARKRHHYLLARLRKRPGFIPPYWRKVTSGIGLDGYVQKRDTQLVLDSQAIPFRLSRFRGEEHLYVPPLLERRARDEIQGYEAEKSRHHPITARFPVYTDCALASFFLLPLIFWHGMQLGWWPCPHFLPAPEAWQALGKIDAAKIIFAREWHRIGTALTLHSGLPHLFSNVAFGALFLALLARVAGIGRAFFLTVLGGILGNALSVAMHKYNYQSIGFSTALFASIGILASITTSRMTLRQKIFMPAAAAMALLAMLGTEGENTDYVAHICGLASGLLIGFWEYYRVARSYPALSQFWAGLSGLFLLFAGWLPVFISHAGKI